MVCFYADPKALPDQDSENDSESASIPLPDDAV